MRKILSGTFFILLLGVSLYGQAGKLGYGFKAGLSYSKIDGPSEMAGETELETNDLTNGFFVGAIFRYWFTDLVGVKGELLYAQKGTGYTFSGDGYQSFPKETGGRVVLNNGTQTLSMSLTNSYLDIPVLVYGKFGRLEVEGGVNIGFLISSLATGELAFTGTSAVGTPLDEVLLTIDYNFLKDRAGEVNFADGVQTIDIGGQNANIPSILTAYYQFDGPNDNLYKTIDIGLNAGIYYYWNQGLFLGGRLNYGLTDVTADGYDVSRASLDSNGDFIPRSDKDRNISLQFSLGFSF